MESGEWGCFKVGGVVASQGCDGAQRYSCAGCGLTARGVDEAGARAAVLSAARADIYACSLTLRIWAVDGCHRGGKPYARVRHLDAATDEH